MREHVGRWAVVAALSAACGDSEGKPPALPAVPVESTTAGAARPVSGAPSAAGARVLIVGTSLTAGLGLDPDSAYPAVLQRLADSSGYRVTVVAAGLSGETSAGALRRVEWLLKEPVDVVVIESGANDGLRGLRPDSTKANLVGIVRKVRAARPSARVMLAQMEAPPNLGPAFTRGFRELFLEISRDEGVTLVPFFLEGVAGNRALNQEDGIHPNSDGARLAARNMWKALGPVLREVPGALPR